MRHLPYTQHVQKVIADVLGGWKSTYLPQTQSQILIHLLFGSFPETITSLTWFFYESCRCVTWHLLATKLSSQPEPLGVRLDLRMNFILQFNRTRLWPRKWSTNLRKAVPKAKREKMVKSSTKSKGECKCSGLRWLHFDFEIIPAIILHWIDQGSIYHQSLFWRAQAHGD